MSVLRVPLLDVSLRYNKIVVIKNGVGHTLSLSSQGINFLDILFEIFTNHKISYEVMKDEIEKWLKLLLQLVDITEFKAVDHFTLFIKSNQKVMKNYCTKYVSIGHYYFVVMHMIFVVTVPTAKCGLA